MPSPPYSSATSEHHNGEENSVSLPPFHTHTHNTHCNISSCQLHLIPLRLLARARPCFLPHLAPPLARIADIFGFLCFQHHEQDDLSFFRSLCYMLSQKSTQLTKLEKLAWSYAWLTKQSSVKWKEKKDKC